MSAVQIEQYKSRNVRQTAGFTTFNRVTKPGEWQAVKTATLSQSLLAKPKNLTAKELAKIPEAYPLYRLEVLAAEKVDALQP